MIILSINPEQFVLLNTNKWF